MSGIQTVLYMMEVGKGRIFVRLIPLVIATLIVAILYDFNGINLSYLGSLGGIYHGLNDAQSMDNAQLARQIARGQGYTTMFLRPYAVQQFQDHVVSQGGSSNLFPADAFPPGVARLLPDTYNAPGYPYLLAAWFRITRPDFDLTTAYMRDHPLFTGDMWIPEFNQIFLGLTALLIFRLALRLFDQRVAWLATIAFLTSDIVWRYTITALSTSLLMFLVTGLLFSILEIFCIGETCADNEESSSGWEWLWALLLALLLAAACLTRLHLLILLMPLVAFLALIPRPNLLLIPAVSILVIIAVAAWLWHIYKISGNPLGSNLPWLLYGNFGYKENQIFCTTIIPPYELLLRNASLKEFLGIRWHFEHAWDLLGSSPLILFFGASILHSFKRRRCQAFRWLVLSCAISIIAVNNLGVAEPTAVDPWNTLVVLLPVVLVIGSAFFFILLDRLNIEIELINNLIVIAVLFFSSVPLILTLVVPNYKIINYPPYAPSEINLCGRLALPEEWITSDMPWATAWYADHASLWLPDSIVDFERLHDNVCPTALLLLTPVTLEAPVTNLTSGEDKDWYAFIIGVNLPANFPLQAHTVINPQCYVLWSDRERWK